MHATRETIDLRPVSGPVDPAIVVAIERAIVARLPFLEPWISFLSRLTRFLTVGIIGLGVDTGVFGGFYSHGASAASARAASLAVATIVTWYLNRLCTFGPSGRAPLAEMGRYFGVALVAQGFNYVVFLSLHYATGETRPFACLLAAAVLTAAFSFTGQSAFAFARSRVGASRIHS